MTPFYDQAAKVEAGGLTRIAAGEHPEVGTGRLGLEGLSDDLVEEQRGGNEEEPGEH